MKPFRLINLLATALAALLLAGCGYYNPNMLPADQQLPASSFYVPLWTNPTNEMGLESRIHNAVHNRLIQSKNITLTNTRETADYVMEGSIGSVQFPGRSYDLTNTATAQKAILSVSYSITEQKTGKRIWSESKAMEEPFDIGSATTISEASKKKALDTMVEDLAEHIYIRTFKALSRHNRRGGKKTGEKDS